MTLPQTVNKPPENALQRATVARLRGDATLAGLLAAAYKVTPTAPAVLDEVKEGQPFPYVRVGDHLSTPSGDHTRFGRQVTMTLHVWTKVQSMGPGQTIADRIVALLDHQHDALSALMAPHGHRCVLIHWQFGQAIDDTDPEIRHHVIRFRVETQQLT